MKVEYRIQNTQNRIIISKKGPFDTSALLRTGEKNKSIINIEQGIMNFEVKFVSLGLCGKNLVYSCEFVVSWI